MEGLRSVFHQTQRTQRTVLCVILRRKWRRRRNDRNDAFIFALFACVRCVGRKPCRLLNRIRDPSTLGQNFASAAWSQKCVARTLRCLRCVARQSVLLAGALNVAWLGEWPRARQRVGARRRLQLVQYRDETSEAPARPCDPVVPRTRVDWRQRWWWWWWWW